MVEQNAKQALSIANRGYVLVNGENRRDGSGQDLLNDSNNLKFSPSLYCNISSL